MPKFRKKPVEIEARGPLTPLNSAEIRAWCDGWERAAVGPTDSPSRFDGSLIINTLEGPMSALIGDYVIRGIEGEFYPCKPAIFEATYEPVEE